MVSEWQQPDVEILRGQIRRAAAQSSALCVVALATGYPMLSRLFSFPELMADRLAFALQTDVFVMFWILFGVGLVSRGRRHSPEDIGGAISGPASPRIAIMAAFLQNTLEQAVLIVGMHLALVTLLPRDALSLIVVSVALFAIATSHILVRLPQRCRRQSRSVCLQPRHPPSRAFFLQSSSSFAG